MVSIAQLGVIFKDHLASPAAQVVADFAWDDDLVVEQAALLQFAHDVPADAMRADAAGDDDDFAGPVVGRPRDHAGMIIGTRQYVSDNQ